MVDTGRILGFESGLLERVQAAVLATDLTGRVLYANRFCEMLYGRSPEEMEGRLASEFSIEPVTEELRGEIGKVVLAGLTWEGDFTVARKGGGEIEVHAIDSPLFDRAGNVTGVVSLAFDVTEQHRQQDRVHHAIDVQRFFADTSTLLAWSLDDPDLFSRLAQLSVPFLADLCLIDVAEHRALRRRAAAHADPEKQRLVDELEARYPPDPRGAHPAVSVLRTGKSEHSAEMSPEFLRATTRDEEHLRIVRELQFDSYMCVPLVARGRILGAFTLVSSGSGRRFGPDELEIAEEFARRAALALDNARVYHQQVHIARTLQASLLPPTLPDIDGLQIAALYTAVGQGNEVGGDFYDVIQSRGSSWCLAIGDVSGKGPEAAATAGLIRHSLRAATLRERSPKRLLEVVNEALMAADHEHFCTVACALVRPTPRGAQILVTSGGHPPPLIIRDDGVLQPECEGTLLGVIESPPLRNQTLHLELGETIVFFTDGVTEARAPDGTLFGDERLQDLLRRHHDVAPDELVAHIIAAVSEFDRGDHRDDIALLVVRVTGT